MQNINEILGYTLAAIVIAIALEVRLMLQRRRLGEKKCTCPVCGSVHRDNRLDTSPPSQTEKR